MTQKDINDLSPSAIGEELADFIGEKHRLLSESLADTSVNFNETLVTEMEREWEREFWERKTHELAGRLSEIYTNNPHFTKIKV